MKIRNYTAIEKLIADNDCFDHSEQAKKLCENASKLNCMKRDLEWHLKETKQSIAESDDTEVIQFLEESQKDTLALLAAVNDKLSIFWQPIRHPFIKPSNQESKSNK